MKDFDLVEIINSESYKANNLNIGHVGIIVKIYDDYADVLFFNPQNIGDYAIVKVKNSDMVVKKEKLPKEFKDGLLEKAVEYFGSEKRALTNMPF